MSYLNLLQQQIQRDQENARRFASTIGSGFEAYFQEQERQRQLQQQEQQRKEQMALRQAEFIQQRLPGMRQAGMYKEMAGLLPAYRQAVKTGYGIDIPGGDVVGAPVYGKPTTEQPRPAPSFIGPMPLGPAPELRREFGGAMTRRALDERFMLPPDQPEYRAVGGALFDPRAKEFLVPPTQLTAEQRLGVEDEKIKSRFELERIKAESRAKNLRVAEALRSMRPGRGVKLINAMLDDGTVVRVPDVEGVVVKNPRDPELVQINAGGQLVWGRKVEGAPVYTTGADPFLQQSRRNEAFMGWLRINNPELYSRVYGLYSVGVTPLDKQEIDKNLSVFNSEIARRQPPMPPPMPPTVPTGGIPAPPILPPSTPRPQMTPRVLLPPLPRSSVPPGAPPVPTSPMATPRPTPRPTKKPTTTLPASRRPREAPNPNKAPSDYL